MKKALLIITGVVACSMASAQVSFYGTSGAWDTGRAGAGHTVFNGFEDFEGNDAAAGTATGHDDPLTTGIANGNFLGGLSHPGLTTQSNMSTTSGLTVDPRGATGLALLTVGLIGNVSDVVVSNSFVDSQDYLFAGGVNAVGFDVLELLGANTVDFLVFDTANNLIGSTTSAAEATGINFLGMTSNVAIGRINLNTPNSGGEGLDNLTTFNAVPEPASMIALGLGAAAMLRRRKKA